MLFVFCSILVLQPLGICGEKEAPPSSPSLPAEVKFPLPNPSEIGPEKFSALLNAFLLQGGYSKWQSDLRPRPTGSFTVHPSGIVESYGIHGPAAVRVVYSPQVWEWMENGRKGLIADGGIIIKLLYDRDLKNPALFSREVTGFSIMVKDSKGSWDGWFYSDGGPLQKPTHEHAANFFDPNAGFALSCMNCHASADNPEGTYSSARNVTVAPSIKHITEISAEGLRKGLIFPNDIHSSQEMKPAVKRAMKEPAPYWDHADRIVWFNEPNPQPLTIMDHVPQGPRPHGHRQFLTSSNCNACHNAVQLYTARPNMAINEDTKKAESPLINLSPSSEWRYSMMGLSGRDPVFFAQLESERALHPDLADQIDNKCLSCHAAMGQREWKKDHGPEALFTHQIALARPGEAHEKYGALARDGVSCVICHQMLPDGLGTPRTYSGNFKLLDKPTTIFGPYDKVAVLPMQQSLGLTPLKGAHISESKMCASCHTVSVPVLDVKRKYTPDEFKQINESKDPSKSFHEQATYLEWQNSSFSTETGTANPKQQSCQACHMPKTYKGEKLRFKIANIEDETFPAVDNRASNEQLHMDVREDYSRHALHGINLFTLEMFKQNPTVLGVPPKDNLFPAGKSGFDVAIQSVLKMAQEQTAIVKVLSAKRDGKRLLAQVKVTNLAGHKFPTGVSFRRAFIELKVTTKAGKTLWVSGATDKWGVLGTIEDERFAPLKTEFFDGNEFQPHHQKITREDQVQIYEQLIAGSDGIISTSFLSLKTVLKDNRLLPFGWKANGPNAAIIHAKGTEDDADYQNGEASDIVRYEVPIDAPEGEALSVSATLYYQALPPYYLKRRFQFVDKPATQRLYYLVNQLDLSDTAARDWKMKIGQDEKRTE